MSRGFGWSVALSLVLGGCTTAPFDVRHAPGASDPAGPPADPSDPQDDPDGTEPTDDPTGDETEPEPEPDDPTGDDACPPGITCVDTLPFVVDDSTSGGDAVLDGYGCAPSIDESGPERIYRVELADEGLLVASLDGLPAGVDVDVHLLEESDPGACIDRGHWDAAALLPAGTYWVVVDSWVDADGVVYDGDYTLTLSQTRAGDHTADGLYSDALDAALYAFDVAWAAGDTDRLEYAVLDFSVPSVDPRMFVLDLRTNELLFVELASHGIGSQDPNDLTLADSFSNVSGSNASSLGLVRAAETYWGSNGYSLRLDGLEPGYNDNVRDRAIVIHAADYATQDFVDDNGYLGRSQGCPAVDPVVHEDLIDTLAEGGLLFAYYPDPQWIAASDYLRGF